MTEFVCMRLDYEKCDEVINEYLESMGDTRRLSKCSLVRVANWRTIEKKIIYCNITKELLIEQYLENERWFQYEDRLKWSKQNL